MAAYRRALELKPDFAVAHSSLIFMLDLLESTDSAQQQDDVAAGTSSTASGLRRNQAARQRAGPRAKVARGLCVGRLSQALGLLFFAPVVCGHDRTGFEVFCYSGVKREDDATARLRQATQAWRSR